jgi:Domain of unknown function (DUF6431)
LLSPRPLTAHGFYTRTLIDAAFDGTIRVRRYLCQACQRTVSLLPEFVLPYLRSSLAVMALFLITRLLLAQTLNGAAGTVPPPMPYQRGQFWIRRFRAQAETLCVALSESASVRNSPPPRYRCRLMSDSATHYSRAIIDSGPIHARHGPLPKSSRIRERPWSPRSCMRW